MAYNEVLYGDGHSFDLVLIPAGVAFVARWELFVPRWYEDGHWRSGPKRGQPKFSCCYGHQEGGDNWPFVYDPNQTFTHEQALDILRADLESKARSVRNRLKVAVNSYQFNALVSLVFNYGATNVDAVNSVFPPLNEEKYVAASVGFLACNKITNLDGTVVAINGLTLRRACEMELFSRKIMKS